MKQLSLLLLTICMAFFSTQSILAQDTNKKKEAKVKIFINKNGKSVKFDTIIREFKDHKELMKIIKSKNLPDSLFETFKGEDFMWFSDDKDSHGKHKVIVNEYHISDSAHHSKSKSSSSCHLKYIIDDNDDDTIVIHESDGKNKTIKINVIDDKDGNVILNHSKGEKVIIIKDNDDVEVTEDGDVKIIRIMTNSKCHLTTEGEEEIEIEVEINDDGKQVKKMKKKRKKSKKQEKSDK